MSQLTDIENKFQNYLLHQHDDIEQHIVSTNKVPAAIRLKIYGDAYRSRLIEALSTSYPMLHKYLGDEQFEELALAYLIAHPSEFRSIRWFGDQLAHFLQEQLRYQDFPFLAELAALEWTMALVFDAANHDFISLEQMSQVPPEAWVNMQFQFHPSIHRLDLSWNVAAIWQALIDEQIPPEPVKNSEPEAWLFWRNDLFCQYSALAPDEAWAVDAIMRQASFGAICEGICQWVSEHDAGMRAASLLKGWISAGLIANINIID